jgi:hypothetical protein
MIPAKQLLNEIATSLRTVVAPALAEPYPKTQAYMAAIILDFIARQVDERSDIADNKRASLIELFRELGTLDRNNTLSEDVAPTEAGLCRLIERLYVHREQLGGAAFTTANRLVRDALRKLLDQELTIAGKAEE